MVLKKLSLEYSDFNSENMTEVENYVLQNCSKGEGPLRDMPVPEDEKKEEELKNSTESMRRPS